ncbi:hypothetical protein [Streptosporangium sp. CA-115845]|uniref:hypothetical protein n=1 Tax=Streptosporangium sp. CA-115845 TaxID=3240071 RepID=UPI003D8D3500
MSIYAPPSTAMITEPVLVLILHCSRCNKPFTDYETASIVYWPTREIAEAAFVGDGPDGWAKVGDRYLCDGCWHRNRDNAAVEAGPLRAIDDVVAIRERAGYASSTEIGGLVEEVARTARACQDHARNVDTLAEMTRSALVAAHRDGADAGIRALCEQAAMVPELFDGLDLPHLCGNCEGVDPETCLNRPRVSGSRAPGGVGGADEDAPRRPLEATESVSQR